jgi:CheY-like chemotaxis protein
MEDRNSQPRRKLSVLYITPNHADFVLLSRFVSGEAVSLHHQETGVAAREQLALVQESELPNLIVVAGRLPMLTAAELVTELKDDERTRAIPVVVLSSFVNGADTRRLYSAGASCVVALPADLSRSEQVLSSVAGLWLNYAELPGAQSV